jgi:hypothetical protein
MIQIRTALGTEKREVMKAGGKTIEVARVRICGGGAGGS